jgi:hypothetical protein
MSRPAQDLQGKTFGGWDVLHRNESDPTVRTNWFCRCRFCDAIQSVQARANRLLLAFGREQCIAAWAEELKIPGECIRKRIDVYGWSIERALTTPSRLAGKTLTIRSDGKRQWSLRSRGDGVDVSAVAKARGGGGHRNAAGFEENS